jgi:predicted nucleic acid-binding protein
MIQRRLGQELTKVEIEWWPVGVLVSWDLISERAAIEDYQAAVSFLEEVKPHLTIVDYGTGVREEAEAIFRRYGRSRRLSFWDAISFVMVTTLLDHVPCLAFDTDFAASVSR